MRDKVKRQSIIDANFSFLACKWLLKVLLTSLPVFFLRCWDGYVGNKCQFRDPCTSSPCMNGGTCNVVSKGTTVDFSCTCRLGYTDRRCLTPVNNVCISSPCRNGGTCELESLQTYKCRCPPGWSGNTQQYYDSREVLSSVGVGCKIYLKGLQDDKQNTKIEKNKYKNIQTCF